MPLNVSIVRDGELPRRFERIPNYVILDDGSEYGVAVVAVRVAGVNNEIWLITAYQGLHGHTIRGNEPKAMVLLSKKCPTATFYIADYVLLSAVFV